MDCCIKQFFMMSINSNIISWNYRGAAGKDFYKFSKYYNDIYKHAIFVFMETRSDHLKRQKCLIKMGYHNCIATSNVGYAGGILVACKDKELVVSLCSKNEQFVHVLIKK